MHRLPGAAVFLSALAIVPGWSFYYDVTPKAAVVFLAATLASIHLFWTPLVARWNTILGAGFAASVAVSAALSPYVALAWWGSNWRRSGAAAMIAVVLIAIAAGTLASRAWLMRSICSTGVAAGAYAIAQYFGWDPLLPSGGYHFGEGEYRIVRPPGTMGHANYLAAFLLWPVFCGVDLWRAEDRWKWLGVAASLIGVVAILLCGSRGAWAGLLAGGVAVSISARPSWKRAGAGAAVLIAMAALFYASPAGDRLRARVFWIGEDAAGGSRLLLWRDSLAMIAKQPVIGYGPEAFVSVFPQHQSAELSRAYPDFYHESPHNMFLDVLAGQGIVGLVLLVAWIALALRRGRNDPALWAALIAAIVAHQFAVWVLPNALLFFVSLSILSSKDVPIRGSGRSESVESRQSTWPGALKWAFVPAAILAVSLASRTVITDARLADVKRALDADDASHAAALWGEGVRGAGVSADVYFSRRWAQVSIDARDTLSKLRYAQLAGNAAAAATRSSEQRQNAFYNLAQLEAAANDNAAVEASLRGAIAAAPTWFKPHWALARLLWLMGRPAEARQEAQIALDLNGGRDAEVGETLDEILRSAHTRR